MRTNALSALETDATTEKRAQYEAFEFELEAPGLVRVRNGSYGDEAGDHEYLVNVVRGVPDACECPAFEYHPGACKHMTAIAIRNPVLDAATYDVATDGGVIAAGDEGELVDADDEEACPNGETWCPGTETDDDALPCFACFLEAGEVA